MLTVIPICDGSRPKRRRRSLVVGAATKGERAVSEAAAGGGRRAEIERTLVQRSLEDESFRQRLLDDPKGAVEQELGSGLPEGVEVRVVEESAQTMYLVLPSTSAVGEGGELSDQELEAVAGRRRRVIGQTHARAVAEDLMRSRPTRRAPPPHHQPRRCSRVHGQGFPPSEPLVRQLGKL